MGSNGELVEMVRESARRRTNQYRTKIIRAAVYALSLRGEHAKTRPWWLEVAEQAFNEFVLGATSERFHRLPAIIADEEWRAAVSAAREWMEATACEEGKTSHRLEGVAGDSEGCAGS